MDVRDHRRPQSGQSSSTSIFDPGMATSSTRLRQLLKFLLPILLAVWVYRAIYPDLDDDLQRTVIHDIPISAVLKANLHLVPPRRSWEFGVLTHALLELQNPELTVFAGPGVGFALKKVPGLSEIEAFPGGGGLPKANGRRYDDWTRVKGLRMAAGLIWTNGSNAVRAPESMEGVSGSGEMMGTLVDGDGSVADAASLGWACLLLEAAGAEDPRNPVGDASKGSDGKWKIRNVFGEAADRQVMCLIDSSGRCNVHYKVGMEAGGNERQANDGTGGWHRKTNRWAISHRNNSQQLWGDSVFMFPPFLAAYAVARRDVTWLQEAVEQITVYREELVTTIDVSEKEEVCSGAWKHIVTQPRQLEQGECCHDENVWLTSNAWALAGMTRVLATVLKWRPPADVEGLDDFGGSYEKFRKDAENQLLGVINPMLECLKNQEKDLESGLMKNYLDGPKSLSQTWSYGDAAGTALVTGAVYRLAVLEPKPYAKDEWLDWADENFNSVAKHISEEGVLSPVADIANIPSKTPVEKTSESQSMVILMWSARRDCVKLGICKTNVRRGWKNILAIR